MHLIIHQDSGGQSCTRNQHIDARQTHTTSPNLHNSRSLSPTTNLWNQVVPSEPISLQVKSPSKPEPPAPSLPSEQKAVEKPAHRTQAFPALASQSRAPENLLNAWFGGALVGDAHDCRKAMWDGEVVDFFFPLRFPKHLCFALETAQRLQAVVATRGGIIMELAREERS